MKKFLVLAVSAVALFACAKNKVEDSSAAAYRQQQKALITDQEFDKVLAPKLDYETEISYEQQLRTSGTFVKGTQGSSKKTSAKKSK
ncbi:hypothetical protein Emin_0418 [Elusimicrobium minutum Pei191]|uniref:Lipoprotein n=1 Tax=Elusimicrobium minutum (strain Pei191) TaxID=445932 RepID=B2KBF3_ELUMP|nr:hypothetical protein [Elusimicrobium minutum]ACC97975.1 hypothetical protein Emin_0418 [Elusimicrobium minutum Pei191]